MTALFGAAINLALRGVVKGFSVISGPQKKSTLWPEITGVFFLLPVVVFAPRLWAERASWVYGPDHWNFLVTASVMAFFLYMSVTSFWRVHKR